MSTTSDGTTDERPSRLTVSEVARTLLERQRPTTGPVIAIDYRKHPGDQQMRTTWHIELPAEFEDDETDRMFAKACELHNSFLALYAEPTQPIGKEPSE